MTVKSDKKSKPTASARNDEKTFEQDRPGELRGEAKLTIQTWQCQRLVYGRKKTDKKDAIIGLIGFAQKVKTLWQSCIADDPYADYYLLKLYEAIEGSRSKIREYRKAIEKKIASEDGFSISIASSRKPVVIDLAFPNPYGYLAAYLLNEYDHMVRSFLTAKHVGLVKPDYAHKHIEDGAKLVRAVLALASTYKYKAITRKDVVQENARALEAKRLMGELPESVLKGEERSPYAPPLKQDTLSLDDDIPEMELSEELELEAASA